MGDYAPFHVQLQEHLRRRFWTPRHLIQAIIQDAKKNHSESIRTLVAELESRFDSIIAGHLAPTRQLGEIIADTISGRGRPGTAFDLQTRDELVGAAYVAESHGRRQQPPYLLGVLGGAKSAAKNLTREHAESRQSKLEAELRQRMLRRLIEFEQKSEQASRQRVQMLDAQRDKPVPEKPPGRSLQALRRRRSDRPPVTPLAAWKAAAAASVRYIPNSGCVRDPACAESFVHVVERCFTAGHQFSKFLNELLLTWRSEAPTSRGRIQHRMSPEQLGDVVGQRNRERYSGVPEKLAWFRRHNGMAVTGNSLRNYLTQHTAKPQRECVQKLIWAFVADDPIQLDVEQRIWRMAADRFLICPATGELLVELVSSDWTQQATRRRYADLFSAARNRLPDAGIIRVRSPESSTTFAALADRSGSLLTPLVNLSTGRILADIAHVHVEKRTMLSAIDVAVESGSRSRLIRTLITASGIPITRIAELTGIHESLFQQWMRENCNQRIEDRQRAITLVGLLNPPDLARWPVTPEHIRQQNEQAVAILHSNNHSLARALELSATQPLPAGLKLTDEAKKTYRAALLLRQVFGRDSVSGLTGPQTGRMMSEEGLGNFQTIRHLREGIRDGGRKSARRATVQQACFLANLLEAAIGEIDQQLRSQFIECVACVNPDAMQRVESPAELLMHVQDESSPVTIHSMTRQIMHREGGLIRFSGRVGMSPQSLRAFVSGPDHYLHHPVARRLAEFGMGFPPGTEEFRQFVILATAAWKIGGGRIQVRLSEIFRDFFEPASAGAADGRHAQKTVRAVAIGRLLSQAARSPKELAAALNVTLPTLAGWTTPSIARFTSQKALDRFLRLMNYQKEQADFVSQKFGPRD